MSSVISSSTTPSTTSSSSTAATPSTAVTSTTTSPVSTSSASSGSITSTGIGSGLDVSGIVSSLTTAYGLAQNTQLSDRQATLTSQVSAYGVFSSALATLQATLTPLQTPTSLAGRTATLGDTTVATATATSDAIPAQYTLSVQNLATAASLSSAPVASADSSVGSGTLTISVNGQSASINVDSTDSISDIAAAINGAANNPGVSATVLSTSQGARLVIAGTSTGAANAINVTQSGGDGGLAALTYDPANGDTGLTQTQAASDANFTINGFAASSPSNQVSSVVSGVTLNLLTTTAANTPTTLTIGNDTTGAQTSVGTFVTALNGLINSIQSLTSYDPSTNTAGPLLGNATLQGFQNQLQQILGQVTSGGSGAVNSLAALGITTNPDGSFTTNSTTLGNALSGNLTSVASLLGGTNGIATQLNSLINTYSGAGGLLASVNQGLQSGLTDVANQQTALNARLATYSATLTQEYNAMDTAVALLKQTQTYLTAEFDPSSSSTSSSSALSSGNVST